MQPQIINSIEHFTNIMAMRVFIEACQQWSVENNKFKFVVSIENMYFDYGQDWKYTGFLTTDTDTDRSWQSLCPRDWDLVVTETDINRIQEMAFYYMDHLAKNDIEVFLYEKFGK